MFDNKRTLLIRTQEHECGGLYKVVLGRKQNGYPVWCCKGERWLYSTRDPEGAWHVTDDESDLETGNALLCCKESHFGCPPDLCSTWQSADGKGRWKVLLQDDFSLVSIDTAASSKRIPPTESDHLIGVRGISPPRTPQRQHRNYKIDSCDRLHQMEIRNHGGNRKPAQYFRDGNSDLAAFEEQLSVLSELAQSPDVDRKLQFLKTLSPTRSKPSEFRNPSHHAINRYQEFPSNQYLDGYPASHLQQVEQSSNVFCEPTQSRCSKPHDSGCRIVPDIISKKAASTPGVQTYFEYPKTLQREDSTDEMLKLTSELVELQMENLKLVREQKVRVSEFDKLSNSHRELYSRYEQVQQQHLQHKQQQHLRQQWHEHQEVAVLQMQQRGSETSREEQDQQSDLSQSKSLEDAEKEKLERINSSSHLYTTPVATPESVRPSSVQVAVLSFILGCLITILFISPESSSYGEPQCPNYATYPEPQTEAIRLMLKYK